MKKPESNEARYTGQDITIILLTCSIVVVVLLFVWALSRSTDSHFASEFSFAATISSIILSIIAIIMSLTSEVKTNSIRRSIKKEVRKLDGAITEIQMMAEAQRKMDDELQNRIDIIEEKVDNIQSDTKTLVINSSNQTIAPSETPDPTIPNIEAEIENDGERLEGNSDGGI